MEVAGGLVFTIRQQLLPLRGCSCFGRRRNIYEVLTYIIQVRLPYRKKWWHFMVL